MIGQRWQIQFFLLFLSSTAGSLPRGRWQSEMKKNSKLGHEREQSSKKRVENTTRNCGKRDQSSRCHHLFSITFRSPENGDIQGDPTSFGQDFSKKVENNKIRKIR